MLHCAVGLHPVHSAAQLHKGRWTASFPPRSCKLTYACCPLVSARHLRPRRDAAEAGAGSKWTLTAFAEWMSRQGHDFEALWSQVGGCSCGLGSVANQQARTVLCPSA